MCGIAGLVGNGQPDQLEAACRRMVRAQVHRGPDDEGLYAVTAADGRQVVLGSRRLAILDLTAAGHQPMGNEDGTIWVVHNGEIYNFAELRDTLHARGHRFRSRTDTEVILRAYQEYGLECVSHLRGMFAFAVWDAGRRRLLLARDRLGEKPLYYAWNGTQLVFASELRAVLASSLISPDLNLAAVRGFLHFGSVPSPVTMISGIHSLEPASRLVLDGGRLSVQRYWDLAFEEAPEMTAEEASEGVLARLQEAVRRQLVSDAPLGAFLSGGIDSSSIVALMREAGAARLRTFCLAFEDADLNEAPFARLVADRFETDHMEYLVTPDDVRGVLDPVMGAMDQPSVDGLNTYLVSQFTRASGAVVALSGLGGDELFGGYSSFWHVPRLCRLGRVAQHIPSSRWALHVAAGALLGDGRARKLQAFLRRPATVETAYYTAKGLLLDGAAESLLAAEARASGTPFDPVAYLEAVTGGRADHPGNQVSRLELRGYLHNQLLRDADAMSMAHALEVRAPLLDDRLVEWVSRIPARLKFGGPPKGLFVRAMGMRLPPSVVNRPKGSFSFPFARWMRGPWRSLVEERLLVAQSGAADVLDQTEVARLWQRFLDGRARWSSVWAVLVLRQWLRAHLPGREAGDDQVRPYELSLVN